MKKKILAAVLAGAMMLSSAVVVSAEEEPDTTVTEDTVFEPHIVVDGVATWNSAGSKKTFPIDELGVTVTFENEPFKRDTENWSNFVFETISGDTDTVKGVSLRADAFGWTYNDNATVEPAWTAETSWGGDWDAFKVSAPGTVKLTAKKASADTVTFSIAFANGATEVYTVTYPGGVPDGLEFVVGADGGKITLQSVAYAGSAAAPSEGDDDDDDDAGNNNTPAPAPSNPTDKGSPSTGVEGVAVIAGLAVIAAGAVVVAKKRK